LALPVDTRLALVLDCPTPLPSTFNTPLLVAPWSTVWPCSYVRCRICATPTPAHCYLLLLFLIYGRHSPFKALPHLRFARVDQGQPHHYFSIRTKYPLPLPPRPCSFTAQRCCYKTSYLFSTQSTLRLTSFFVGLLSFPHAFLLSSYPPLLAAP
jgi:hypothetical protein